MKHIKLFEQFDDYDLDDIFGKEPPLKIVSMGGEYYIAHNFAENGRFFLYDNHPGSFSRWSYGGNSWEMDPIIKDNIEINVYKRNWKKYTYKDLPKEIKDRL